MNVLSGLAQRNGQWYYLSAMANMGLGNNVNALNHIREAVPGAGQHAVPGASAAYGRRRYLVSGTAESLWRNAHGRDGLCMKLCLLKHGLQSLLSRKNLLLLTAGAGKNTAPFCKKNVDREKKVYYHTKVLKH